MIKKTLIIITAFIAFGLAGCITKEDNVVVTTSKAYVIEIPPELLQCNLLGKYPNPEQLTDSQVAFILLQLSRENEFCASNMEKIKQFIVRAKATIR